MKVVLNTWLPERTAVVSRDVYDAVQRVMDEGGKDAELLQRLGITLHRAPEGRLQ